MKTRLLLLTFGVALLGFGSLGAACKSGGEPMTMEEYFQRIDELQDDSDADVNALDARLEALQSADLAEQGPGILQEERARLDEFINALADIEPPAESKAAHDEALRTLRDAGTAFDSAFDQIDPNAASADAFFAPFGSDQFAAAVDHQVQACLQLEEVAGDNSIEVDLNCHNE